MNTWTSLVQIFTAQLVAVGLLVLFVKYGGWLPKGLSDASRGALPRSKPNVR